jgi:hypothetical protein
MITSIIILVIRHVLTSIIILVIRHVITSIIILVIRHVIWFQDDIQIIKHIIAV